MKQNHKLLEHYFKKNSKQKEFVTIINKVFMLIVCVKKQEVEVHFSFDAKRISKIKKQRYRKISLEKGWNYTCKVVENVKSIIDTQTLMGMDVLIKELTRLSLQNSFEKKSRHHNCCQGG